MFKIPGYFSPVAFFILLREALEAGIIVAVLLGFVDQIMAPKNNTINVIPAQVPYKRDDLGSSEALLSGGNGGGVVQYTDVNVNGSGNHESATSTVTGTGTGSSTNSLQEMNKQLDREEEEENIQLRSKAILSRMRKEIWAGAVAGGLCALAIGGGILTAFYLSLGDLWAKGEQLWEGIFCGIASILILIMGLAFLRMNHAKIKWRLKLQQAFQQTSAGGSGSGSGGGGRGERWIMFGLPFVTVLREGLEGIVFIGGVSLSEPFSSIPLAAITGIVVGVVLSTLIYKSSSTTSLSHFLTFSTILLFTIGAGLFSRCIGFIDLHFFIQQLGSLHDDWPPAEGAGDVTESGSGPGSFRVQGNVWHFTWGNPEPGAPGTSGFYQLANSLVGWHNTASVWTILAYNAYWLFIILTLVIRKWKEGRTEICGLNSKKGRKLSKWEAVEEASEEAVGLLEDAVVVEEPVAGTSTSVERTD